MEKYEPINIDALTDEGFERLLKRAKTGNAVAQCAAGVCFLAGKFVKPDINRALKYLEESATNAHPDPLAPLILSIMYEEGTVLGRDLKRSQMWRKRALENGGPAPWLELAQMYKSGQGVPRSMARAFLLYFDCIKKWETSRAQKNRITQLMSEMQAVITTTNGRMKWVFTDGSILRNGEREALEVGSKETEAPYPVAPMPGRVFPQLPKWGLFPFKL